LKKADVIVFAGAIQDRYLSSRWKMFFDRTFFNNRSPYLVDKQIAFVISVSLDQISNLRQILEGYVELQQGNLAGIVTDEQDKSSEIDSLIASLAHRLIEYATTDYIRPSTFLGVVGTRFFVIISMGVCAFLFWSIMHSTERAGPTIFLKKTSRQESRVHFLILLTKIPAMRKEVYSKRIIEEMVKPLKKLVEHAA